MRLLAATLLLLATTAALAKPAKIERKPRRFAVRAIRVGGNATDEDRATLAREIGNAIEFVIAGSNRDDLVRSDEGVAVEAAHPELKGCLTARCNLEFGDLVHAERLLWIDITRSGGPGKGDWQVMVSQFAVDSLRNLGTAELPCHACAREELVGAINRFLDPLFKNEPPPLPLCTLQIASRPPGALVLIGADPVGETPFTHSVSAERHRVTVEKSGFARSESEVECAPRTTQHLLLALPQLVAGRPVEAAPSARRSPALKILGGGLLVLGAAGVVAGGVDLARDGHGACTLGNGHTQCKTLYATSTEGAAFVGVGTAAVLGGVISLVADALLGRPAPVHAEARIDSSGAFLAAAGRF